MRYTDLRHVIEFVYKGEIDVAQEQLDNLLQTADQVRLVNQLQGLCVLAYVHRLEGRADSEVQVPLYRVFDDNSHGKVLYNSK